MINTFLKNIIWLRKYYGLTKKEMAGKLGIGVWTLNRIEKGELPPRLNIDVLFYIYKEFGISMSDMLSVRFGCGTEEK